MEFKSSGWPEQGSLYIVLGFQRDEVSFAYYEDTVEMFRETHAQDAFQIEEGCGASVTSLR